VEDTTKMGEPRRHSLFRAQILFATVIHQNTNDFKTKETKEKQKNQFFLKTRVKKYSAHLINGARTLFFLFSVPIVQLVRVLHPPFMLFSQGSCSFSSSDG